MEPISFDCTPRECRVFLERRLAGRVAYALRRLEDKRPWYPRLNALPEDRARALAAYERRCAFCAIDLGRDGGVDLIVPGTRGGTTQAENLVAACERCKDARRGRHLDAFLESRIDLDARAVYARIARATAVIRAASSRDRSAG